ncbi:hypothetical protein [Streptomyces odontomachi]|uniref:hypothetical protein n=1 Tax=Streptomyces odontomachi TaxID=2944940 RepID=UPI00210E245B|nr:hypothetical protein [Streptomyces sp. ODS25]
MTLSLAQKVGVAAVAVAAIGGVSFGATAFAAGGQQDGHRSATSVAAQPAAKSVAKSSAKSSAAAAEDTAPRMVSQKIAEGVVDGLAWSVTLEFYPTLPDGYDPPEFGGKGLPAAAKKELQDKDALLCQRMVIDGVLIDHQGGPWADCQAVDGAHDPMGSGGAGLWGFQDKGTSGSRLFVATPQANVAYGVVRLADGTDLKGTTVAVPHTGYRAWAVAIPDGKTITAVDTYEADGTLVDHDTMWR